ncbi:WSC-domain-containing protein [Corynespora cassiicola Philippines]|uniref:WSC-domain-containing protein n=1 Tax=Corynespora cassiicola Philippines TaxID=1448308 RepID=A0A2T2NC75_CORCC|nr:WSC-domain-containing protein [Corynespora cassiicola Philippines]
MRQSLALLFMGLALPPAWSATLPRNPAPILPIPWQYLGCYSDNPSNRVLSKATYKDEAYMTGESCVRFCSDNGYSFAGTEYSSECWCGFQIQGSESHPDGCDMVCAGDESQTCGGPSRLSVYTSGASEPQTNAGVNAYSLLGCYSDSVHTRTLSHKVAVEGYMSVSKCTAECKVRGYSLSGVEYADECFCGNSVQNNAIAFTGNPSNTGCDMVCRGNSSEYCGGRDRLNIYRRDEDQPGTTPTSTSTPVPTPTTEPPVNLLNNGGFEESYGWSSGRNPVIYNISPLSAQNSWLTPYAYTGTHASAIGEFTSPGTGHTLAGLHHHPRDKHQLQIQSGLISSLITPE